MPNRQAWSHIIQGSLTLKGEIIKAGDGMGISEEQNITLIGQGNETEFLLFDLP